MVCGGLEELEMGLGYIEFKHVIHMNETDNNETTLRTRMQSHLTSTLEPAGIHSSSNVYRKHECGAHYHCPLFRSSHKVRPLRNELNGKGSTACE